MPRPLTGNPHGRPKGRTSALTEAAYTRISVRIEQSLFDRLAAYAGSQTYHKGAPEVSKYIREALRHYLICPNNRQTENNPHEEKRDTPSVRQPKEPAPAVLQEPGPDVYRATMRQQIQRMRQEQWSYGKIAAHLNQQALPTVSGIGKWSKGSVERLAKED